MCGVTIRPGDLIFADNDDVVVVPKERAEEVYEITLAREKKEEVLLKRIQNHEGTTYDLSGFCKIVESLNLSEEPD
jgi:4-hydroxy-4-methyl-2-oxoglutarate aldolase